MRAVWARSDQAGDEVPVAKRLGPDAEGRVLPVPDGGTGDAEGLVDGSLSANCVTTTCPGNDAVGRTDTRRFLKGLLRAAGLRAVKVEELPPPGVLPK